MSIAVETWNPALAASGSERSVALEAAPAAWPYRTLAILLTLIVVVSSANYNPVLFGYRPETPLNGQQYAGLLLWTVVIGLGIRTPRRIRIAPRLDLLAALVFFAYVIASSSWSQAGASSGLKALAFAITTLGAYVVASALTVAVIVDCVTMGLACLALASLASVVAIPSVAVISTWMHNGQWSGIYESKQSLGSVGAFLMFFSFCRYRLRGGWLPSAIAFGLGAACVVGSGSRGGGAIALCALACVLVAKRNTFVPRLLAVVPTICVAFATVTLLDLKASGRPYLVLFGETTDLTERVIIWQHALARLDGRIWFGYGLNGFWTLADVYDTFLRQHGWVLDNFHNGYLAILTETGLVGLGLFAAVCVLFAVCVCASADRIAIGPVELNTITSFVALVFLFDMTETLFLRSTTATATLLTILLLGSAGTPMHRPEDVGGRTSP